jgi:hypothetical protein
MVPAQGATALIIAIGAAGYFHAARRRAHGVTLRLPSRGKNPTGQQVQAPTAGAGCGGGFIFATQ